MSNDHEMFDLESARQAEARRRLRVLGYLIDEPYSYYRFEERSWETQVPVKVLRKCLKSNGCQPKGGISCSCEDTTIPKRFD